MKFLMKNGFQDDMPRKSSQDAPKTAQDAPKMPPRRPQDGPRRSQDGPRCREEVPKDGPSRPEVAPQKPKEIQNLCYSSTISILRKAENTYVRANEC